jgi:hypothetical protein
MFRGWETVAAMGSHDFVQRRKVEDDKDGKFDGYRKDEAGGGIRQPRPVCKCQCRMIRKFASSLKLRQTM